MELKSYTLHIKNQVAYANINNPTKANAMDKNFWTETIGLMQYLDKKPEVRVIVLGGEGKHFSSGIDLSMLMMLQQKTQKFKDEGRKREYLRLWIKELQDTFTSIEKCRKPVIASIKGACVGGAIDMVTACDMRYASENAQFSIKEVDLGIVADVGTLQRISGIVSESIARELAFTGRAFDAKEAKEMQLINQYYPDEETLSQKVQEIAENIAKKSPLTTRGIKQIMNYSRNHSIEEGLDYVATWNASMLLSDDVQEAILAFTQKREPKFAD